MAESKPESAKGEAAPASLTAINPYSTDADVFASMPMEDGQSEVSRDTLA